jgi:general secretion pathway protein F
MPSYDYLALDTGGRERRGSVVAAGLEDARAKLDARKFYVVRIETGPDVPTNVPSLLQRRISFRKHLTSKQLTLFTRQIATLVSVSPLEESLRTVSHQTEQEHVRTVLKSVHKGVLEGRRFSEAMAISPKSFPPLYRAMVAAGEGSGTLPLILDRLADLLERQAQVRGKVLTAIAYPLVLALVATVVVLALMIFVVPQVVEQFESVGQELPSSPAPLSPSPNSCRTGGGPFSWACCCRSSARRASCVRAQPATPSTAPRSACRSSAASPATSTPRAWPGRSPPWSPAACPCSKACSSPPAPSTTASQEGVEDIVEAIRGGGSLSAAFKRAGVFPPLLVYMTASGEASGQLDTMMERAADYLEREFDTFTATALSLLEPAIIVIMGAIVALIVLSILLPILQLDTLAGA